MRTHACAPLSRLTGIRARAVITLAHVCRVAPQPQPRVHEAEIREYEG